MSNFIKRNLADKVEKRGSKLERLLDDFNQDAERTAMRDAEREKAKEEEEEDSSLRGLPRRFGFRRRMNH